MRRLIRFGKRTWAAEAAQGLAEYALILTFVALACVVTLALLGTTLAASPAWTLP